METEMTEKQQQEAVTTISAEQDSTQELVRLERTVLLKQ